MPANFDLVIKADYPSGTAELTLYDADGVQLTFQQTDFKTIALSHWHGLFDLRNYLRHYATEGEEAARVAEIGVCIAEQVLGEEIFKHLWASEAQRTLRIQLPGATEEENHLAAALARVPWEIARPSAGGPTLGERNLLVRVVHEMKPSPTTPLALEANESLRLLFVFAEARGSHPLAARKERRALLDLFAKEIYPRRRVVADFLTHGVTRERLEAQIRENGGYHVVHWSGHGHLNLLELAKPGGAGDHLSGDELLDLFVKAGGFIPRMFFLSACHSGDILRVKDWNDFMAVAQGKEPGAKQAAANQDTTKDIEFEERPGYTGTAHALLQGGVPSVIAMRYAVGDEYARELSVEFYRALLSYAQPQSAAAALTTARQLLLNPQKHDLRRFVVCDHATPVLYGASDPGLTLQPGRSPASNPRDPRLHQITELTTAGHEHFVGRTWELAGLGADFIGTDQQPVAVITGLGGMGKTALTAEALSLWETRFDWVLLYQAKPNALSFETTLRDIHLKLTGELGRYHDHVQVHRADAIYRDANADFTGAERFDRLTRNLIRALKDEAILLVLDNFETNLKPQPENERQREGERERGKEGKTERGSNSSPLSISPSLPLPISPVWACQDAMWDRCLARLAEELRGTRSRVLVTCRRPLAALRGKAHTPVPLGPLPPGEAALYLREHAALSRMFFGSDAAERALAMRLLNASRFHPLLMDRLARLAAGGEALRPQLLEALNTLETSKDFAQLPALFAGKHEEGPGDAKELAYLNDALAASLDQLIQHASPDARRLLWMIAVANEPVELDLLQSVWSGEEDEETQMLRQIKKALEMKHLLPPEVLAQIEAQMTPEMQAILDALPPPTTNQRPPATDLLRQLIAVGLVNEERAAPDDDNPTLSCHELVRERIRARMDEHPSERDGLTENAIRLSFANRLIADFQALRNRKMTAALAAGSRALVYCVQAEAYDRLGEFASQVVTSTSDPRLLAGLIPHLQTAAETAPEGRPRWYCLCNLADALARGGRPDASLPFYEQAAAQARATAASAPVGSDAARLAWADVGAITGNWAGALLYVGNLDAARQRHIESAEAEKNAGRPAVYVIGSELEALRIDIRQGQAAEALPEVETRLAQVEAWWQRQLAGQPVPEAPDPAFLARAYIGALDIATDAHYAQQDWAAALPRIDAIIAVKRALELPTEDIAMTRGNRANVLGRLGRFGEAQAELEACLQLFQHSPADVAKVLSSLADLFAKQGDVAQAIRQQRRALALREQLPDPRDRANSHHNLAGYLERSGAPSALAESPRHRLADLAYCLVAGLGQDMQTSLHNYVISFRRAHAAGTPLAVPRVAELLGDPAFHPLTRWLAARQVDVDELQAAVDELLAQVRQEALGQGENQ